MTQTQEVKKYRSKDLQLWQDVRNQNCHKPEDYNLTKDSFDVRCELYSLIDSYRFDSLTYVRDASIKMYELFASGDLTYTHIRSLVRCIDPKFWLPMIDMIKGMNTKDVYPFLEEYVSIYSIEKRKREGARSVLVEKELEKVKDYLESLIDLCNSRKMETDIDALFTNPPVHHN